MPPLPRLGGGRRRERLSRGLAGDTARAGPVRAAVASVAAGAPSAGAAEAPVTPAGARRRLRDRPRERLL
jgi:hypothetical protein